MEEDAKQKLGQMVLRADQLTTNLIELLAQVPAHLREDKVVINIQDLSNEREMLQDVEKEDIESEIRDLGIVLGILESKIADLVSFLVSHGIVEATITYRFKIFKN